MADETIDLPQIEQPAADGEDGPAAAVRPGRQVADGARRGVGRGGRGVRAGAHHRRLRQAVGRRDRLQVAGQEPRQQRRQRHQRIPLTAADNEKGTKQRNETGTNDPTRVIRTIPKTMQYKNEEEE